MYFDALDTRNTIALSFGSIFLRKLICMNVDITRKAKILLDLTRTVQNGPKGSKIGHGRIQKIGHGCNFPFVLVSMFYCN